MKINFKITEGKDYQADKCWLVSYEEYGTLYTIPQPYYTKRAAKAAIKELNRG
jgi:hypothetical protein